MLRGYNVPTTLMNVPMRDHTDFPDGAVYTTVFSESFANFVDGTETAPAPDQITGEQADALTGIPGWTLFDCYQAGGCVYTGFDEVGDQGPGYIKTPSIDLASGGGMFRIRVMAKNVNPNAQDIGLQAFILDESTNTPILASTEPMVYNEWTECTWTGTKGVAETSFMLFSWQGRVLLKDLVVETVKMELGVPKITNAEMLNVDHVQLSWEKVEGATGYNIHVMASPNVEDAEDYEAFSSKVGDVDNAELNFVVQPNTRYIFYVQAFKGDVLGLDGVQYYDLVPDEIGEGEALEASGITPDGFTANWQKNPFAYSYAVMPMLTRTAQADGEEFTLINDNFAAVPAYHDAYNPLMLSPMLGMGNMDLVMSEQGWSTDFAIMMAMGPGMNCFVFTNMMAAYGLQGKLFSPVADFSTGDDTVHISGSGMTSEGAVIMRAAFIGADGEEYGEQDIEFPDAGEIVDFDVTLEGGQADSQIVMYMYDMEADEEMVAMFALNMTKNLNQGQEITFPAPTQVAPYDKTSCRFDVPVGNGSDYQYRVLPYWDESLWGEVSGFVEVAEPVGVRNTVVDGLAHVSVLNGKLVVINPANLPVAVYDMAGRRIGANNLSHGAYIVTVGQQSFKVML